jgi:hypothetical protein
MPDLLVAMMLSLAALTGWLGVIQLSRSVRRTSLTVATAWAIWFQVTLTVATIATLAKSRVPPGILDQLWYLTAVSALTPFVAVLGARRGRLLEWSLFIVLPLIVVLEWPALAQWRPCWNGQRLELEGPALIAYFLAWTMSLGSYLIMTRFTPAVTCWAYAWMAAIMSLNNSLTDAFAALSPIRPGNHSYLAIAMQILFWLALNWAANVRSRYDGWDRVWQDFRGWFGVLWATRIMARINEVAQREQWPWRLTHGGWEPTSSEQPQRRPPIDDPRIDHTVRWLLKPFVDPEWIDARLKDYTPPNDESCGHE